jgi:predicted enzyme related to lactoylglutathione lyase
MHGQFAWYDLMSPDAAASRKFYLPVTGWKTEMWKGEYTMWVGPKGPLGGIGPVTPADIPPHWLAYVNVDDVDTAAAKVTALGGKVMHGPEQIPEIGRFAIIADPLGAMLAIFKGDVAGMEGYTGTAENGVFTWHELMTTDYQRAFDFYRQLFGWEKIEEMDMGPAGKYLEYGLNGKMFGGIYNRQDNMPAVPPNWLFYVGVKDINTAIAATKKGGGKVMMGPMEVPGGSMVAVAVDSHGAHFGLHQPKAKAAASKPKAKKKAAAKKPKRVVKAKKKTAVKPKSKPKTKKKAARKAKRRR